MIFKNSISTRFCLFLPFLFIIFFSLTIPVYSQSVYKEYDTNGDGKIDRWVWLYNGFETKIIIDQNFDGNPDAEYRYAVGQDGIIPAFQQFDTNFDGNWDDFYYFENGKLVKEEIDSNYDQKVDIIVYIQDNYIYKISMDKDFDGKFETIINY